MFDVEERDVTEIKRARSVERESSSKKAVPGLFSELSGNCTVVPAEGSIKR